MRYSTPALPHANDATPTPRPKKSELSGMQIARNYPRHPETLHTIQKFHSIRKLSRSSGNFPDHPPTFQTIRQLSRPFSNFPDHPPTFQTILQLPRPSRNFPDSLETY